jgi:hypothetical protein
MRRPIDFCQCNSSVTSCELEMKSMPVAHLYRHMAYRFCLNMLEKNSFTVKCGSDSQVKSILFITRICPFYSMPIISQIRP